MTAQQQEDAENLLLLAALIWWLYGRVSTTVRFDYGEGYRAPIMEPQQPQQQPAGSYPTIGYNYSDLGLAAGGIVSVIGKRYAL